MGKKPFLNPHVCLFGCICVVWLVSFHQFVASCFPIADKFITVPFKCDNIDADVLSERNV